MNEEENGPINHIVEYIKKNWAVLLIIILIVVTAVFLFYPRAYSYQLEDTCEFMSGTVNARCIGMRSDLFEHQEKTIGGEFCSIDKQGQKCIGMSIFETLN
jgi:hypothetical protein